jgi:hypothetical protein
MVSVANARDYCSSKPYWKKRVIVLYVPRVVAPSLLAISVYSSNLSHISLTEYSVTVAVSVMAASNSLIVLKALRIVRVNKCIALPIERKLVKLVTNCSIPFEASIEARAVSTKSSRYLRALSAASRSALTTSPYIVDAKSV